MKLIARVKLNPTKEQAKALKGTIEQTNAACNEISNSAWENKTFRQYDLHKLVYNAIRKWFPLSSQVVVRAIKKVSDAYKLDKKTKRQFKPLGAITYDDRILTWYIDKEYVTIWTIDGRQKIPFTCGERQRELLKSRQGESDLVCYKGKFYLLATCEVFEPTQQEIKEALGLDFGIINLATDSDGEAYTGAEIEAKRKWYNQRRAVLQKVGTKSAKRKLKKMSGKQSRYQKNENHKISKRISEKAKRTSRFVAVEDLTGITKRTRARKADRNRLNNWPFRQLREMTAYKLALKGIPMIAVDPRYTSQECSRCGCVAKANRKSQAEFECIHCGHSLNADENAAVNIAARATSTCLWSALPKATDKPLALASGS